MHGAGAPQVQRAAAARVLDGEIEASMAQLGLYEWEEITDPFSAMARMAGKAERLEALLLAKVEDLDSLRSNAGNYGEQIDVVYQAYERAVSRLHALITSMARLDLEDRIASLTAKVDIATAEIVSSALASALSAATLEPDQHAAILTAFGNALRQPALKA